MSDIAEPAQDASSRTPFGWFKRPGRSLTRRLIWLASGWIVLALAITGFFLTSLFQESALRRLGAMLSQTIDELVVATTATPQGVTVAEIRDSQTLRVFSGKYWAVAEPAAEGRLRMVARSTSLWDSDLSVPDDLPPRLNQAFGRTISYNAVGPAGEPLRVAASMKQLPGRNTPVVFLAGIDRSAVDADTRQFATVTWTTLLILGLGLVLAVFVQVKVGLRPLYDLRNEIAAVRKGKAARIARAYPLEIEPLAQQVNRLLDHNQETVERQRTHVGNLAHALKTPIAVMLAEAGTSPGMLPDMVRRQTKVMQDQVDHHLRRARAAARAAHGLGESTPVPEVLDEMAVMLERVFAEKNVEIDWRAPDNLAFLGERQDLQEILGNLMENAAKWSGRRVRVSAGPSGLGQMVVVVEDDGPGLPADRREEVLKRGARLDEDAPGSGLGLSIVDDLTRAYGGRVTLGDSDMGGLKVVLELPAAGD
ncbi:sensor histidine kinase [Brevundimonas sp. S30B]|uniref:sensor histidine kinase n=1 Tax=unclassified Brevundimonas TaxID=2622653 RepID=UPI001071C5CA|nr:MULTISPECIES: sensor histidine kinase [unclassified Brevundimonas]QBX37118.1 sensor histidine kinase [Brevundimonas sp. MF30-B]TFW04087.1 sensor histidine kinase [Brevundimonas sp. S30B]